jgi:outer membrane protein assembly factor BamB
MSGHDAAHSGTAEGPLPPYRVAWETQIGSGGPVTGVAVTDEAAVVLTEGGISALDPADGTVVWEAERIEGAAGVPAIGRGLVVYASSEGPTSQIVARDIEEGNIVWVTVVGSEASAPTISEKTIAVGTRKGEVAALDLGTGVVRWRFETNGSVSGAPAISGGSLVAAAYEPSTATTIVYGVDVATGEQEWQRNLGAVGSPSPLAIRDDSVYLGTNDLNIRAIAEGEELWTSRSRDGFGSRQVPAAGEALIVADRTHAYRLDPETGEEMWTFRLADLTPVGDGRFDTLLASAPAIIDTAVLIGSGGGTLSTIDLDSGHRIWRQDLGDQAVAPLAVAGSLVYAVTLGEDGAVVALEHDPDGKLTDEVSETVLDLGEALLNFAAAAAAVGVVIVLLFRFVLRPRSTEAI